MVHRILGIVFLGLLLAGCNQNPQGNGLGDNAYNGYGTSGGPGGMGSAQGPMPYGDIPGYAAPSGR